MLDAASKADMDTVNVVIALEPEGAVLACLENELSEVCEIFRCTMSNIAVAEQFERPLE